MIFTKVRKVKTPQQAKGDAGIDFFIPEGFSVFTMKPQSSIVVPLGIKVVVPKDFVLIAFNKSGIATNRGLQVGACVVDSGYRGEIHLHLTNVSNKETKVMSGEKIIQFILLPYLHESLDEIPEDFYEEKHNNTERGEGKFGSTDKP